eukprot:8584975-Pyramimonas_sp.AAC.1
MQQWQPHAAGGVYSSEFPEGDEPGAAPGSMLDPLELPQAEYSAFCGGRLVKAPLSERGWTGMV